MKVTTTITLNYNISDSEIEEFRSRVLRRIQEELDENSKLTLDDISKEATEKFLSEALPDIIAEDVTGNNGCYSGVVVDTYFNSISFDYCEEDVSELVYEMAEKILENN